MNERWWAVIVWVVVIFSLVLAATVVAISPVEACAKAGGEWNTAWERCYGD